MMDCHLKNCAAMALTFHLRFALVLILAGSATIPKISVVKSSTDKEILRICQSHALLQWDSNQNNNKLEVRLNNVNSEINVDQLTPKTRSCSILLHSRPWRAQRIRRKLIRVTIEIVHTSTVRMRRG